MPLRIRRWLNYDTSIRQPSRQSIERGYCVLLLKKRAANKKKEADTDIASTHAKQLRSLFCYLLLYPCKFWNARAMSSGERQKLVQRRDALTRVHIGPKSAVEIFKCFKAAIDPPRLWAEQVFACFWWLRGSLAGGSASNSLGVRRGRKTQKAYSRKGRLGHAQKLRNNTKYLWFRR